MKYPIIILACLLAAATPSLAQSKVSASDIVKQINEGRTVAYTNVEIEGDLDLTGLENERPASSGLGRYDNGVYESRVEVPVKFTNCTFLGNVIAYYHSERRDETFIAHFEKDAVFKNCTFKEASEFKYSEFDGLANFSGCTFNEAANFKYAKFSSGPLFSNAKFESDGDFKYAKFPSETSFEKATFQGLANFKYSKFERPLNMEDVAFEGSEDFKYTKIDGRSFTSYLLEK